MMDESIRLTYTTVRCVKCTVQKGKLRLGITSIGYCSVADLLKCVLQNMAFNYYVQDF